MYLLIGLYNIFTLVMLQYLLHICVLLLFILWRLNLFSTNIPYMEHHFHELIMAQWGLIFGIINALLHNTYILNYIKILF